METYPQFVDRHPELPLFYQPGWLDAVAGPGGWSFAASYDKTERIVAVWPFQYGKKWKVLPTIVTPPMSFQLGPWITYPDRMKLASRYDWEWQILGELADRLPRQVVYIHAKAPYQLENWLPLERRGWRQTTRYSYVYPNQWNEEKRWQTLSGRQRTTIRKARERLRVEADPKLEIVYQQLLLSFAHRRKTLPLSFRRLSRVHEYLQETRQSRGYAVLDEQGAVHAAGYLVWDRRSVYNLIQGSDPALRSSGAAALGLWWASNLSVTRGLAFDFEGSHVPGVEKFYRGFGGQLQPYYQLQKGSFLISV